MKFHENYPRKKELVVACDRFSAACDQAGTKISTKIAGPD